MILIEESNPDNFETIELITVDNIIIELQIEDLYFFSKYPDSTLWQIYENDGLNEFKNFIKTYITKTLFVAIVYFYNYDKWPHPISISNIFDAYNFLNLPSISQQVYDDTCYDSESSDINLSDGM